MCYKINSGGKLDGRCPRFPFVSLSRPVSEMDKAPPVAFWVDATLLYSWAVPGGEDKLHANKCGLIRSSPTKSPHPPFSDTSFLFPTSPPFPTEALVMEPLTAGTLECLALGVPTSYKRVIGLTCADLFLGEDLRAPEGINIEALRALAKGETVSECENMLIRSMAAARTFKRRVEAQIIPLGEVADDFNFNTEKKRVLNQVFEPSFDDNVKQDKSIDVYGRADEDFNDEVSKLANA